MAKKGRKTLERERGDEPPLEDVPETQELPHDKLTPFWRNIRWGQVLFGAAFALLLAGLVSSVREAGPRSFATFGFAAATVVAALAFVVYLQNLYRHGLVPDYSLKCRSCNGPVNRYSEFCEHCGFDLIAEEKLVHCPRCELEVYEGTKHCPDCGARIGKGSRSKPRSKPEEPAPEGWDEPLGVGTRPPWER